jgi:glycosyltransferase involved in cell wall biosynthesis
MRILHLDPDDIDNPLSGGAPRRTFEINRRLSSRHEITVLTPTFPTSTPELVRENVRYVRLGRRIGDHGSSHHITYFFSLPAAIRRWPYDLLVEDSMPPATTALSPLFAKAPVILSLQWFYSRTLARQYHIPFHWAERVGFQLYRNFITLSESMRCQVLKWRPNASVITIGNGISDDLFTVSEAPGDTILYLGRIDLEVKGIAMLLQAYAMLQSPRLELILAGFGWQNEAVDRLAGELGVRETVCYVGRVDSDERRRLLEKCRFVVFPSREETFGMVITEACAAGRPVIYFDRPPMNEVASGSGCIAVPAFDVFAYAQAMATLVQAPKCEIIARGRSCRARVSDQRWGTIAARQEEFYFQTLDRRTRGERRKPSE